MGHFYKDKSSELYQNPTDKTIKNLGLTEIDENEYEVLLTRVNQQSDDENSLNERFWRDAMLAKVLNRIDQYEKDQNYADEYKTSSLTAEEYTSLLSDRKRLCDYPDTDGFPDVDRPELSGIVA